MKTTFKGLEITATTFKDFLVETTKYLAQSKKTQLPTAKIINVAAVHLVVESMRNQTFQTRLNRAWMNLPDGMPLVWLLRHRGLKTDRMYGPDLMKLLCALAQKQSYTIALIGGRNGQTTKLKKVLKKHFPTLKIVFDMPTPDKKITSVQDEIIRRTFKKNPPTITFVGTGCPQQEKWMQDNQHQVQTHVLIGVGAAFDFISGYTKQAPRWMQTSGLEWLFRLTQEPKRLWRRYVFCNAYFIVAVLTDWLQSIVKK